MRDCFDIHHGVDRVSDGGIISRSAVYIVFVAVLRVDLVIAGATEEGIDAAAAEEDVVAAVAVEGVVAGGADEVVAAAAAVDDLDGAVEGVVLTGLTAGMRAAQPDDQIRAARVIVGDLGAAAAVEL